MGNKKNKKTSFLQDIKKLSEPQNLIKPVKNINENIMALYEEDELDEELTESEKQWIDEMTKRNLSVDEFNQEFNKEDWFLSISEGSYIKNDGKGNKEEYSGAVLELCNRHKQYSVAMTKYDPKNPYIPQEIFEEMVLW